MLDWVNQVALGFIGLSAGGKLHLNDVQQNLRATLCAPVCLVCDAAVGRSFGLEIDPARLRQAAAMHPPHLALLICL